LHPDRFASAADDVRQASLERMSLLNEAFQLLRSRPQILEFLLAESGLAGAGAPPRAQCSDLELAEEWFEVQEQVLDSDESQAAVSVLVAFSSKLTEAIQAATEALASGQDSFDRAGGDLVAERGALEQLGRVTSRATTLKSMARDVERLKARLKLG